MSSSSKPEYERDIFPVALSHVPPHPIASHPIPVSGHLADQSGASDGNGVLAAGGQSGNREIRR